MGALVAAGLVVVGGGTSASAATLPAGFSEQTAFSGLTLPTNAEFAPDGRVFVTQKNGVVKVFDGLGDTTAAVYADLSAKVHDFWDRGMLGLAVPPDFPAGNPYVYVLYTYDAPIGGSHPTWGDACPSPPGATADGCVVSARLSKLAAGGAETVLINDWCAQYPSHTIGDLQFGGDGKLYVSGGDGASFNWADWGQDGNPVNPCGDPPGAPGTALTPPTAEGGALRSQDVRTLADPTGLDGALLRLDPVTGAALPDNPLYNTTTNANARRIFAYGQRNPFRFTFRPGTNEIWAGDVGWGTWEEINRVVSPTAAAVNFGWPCYEGNARQGSYDGANLNLCENLYAGAGQTAPYFTYNHGSKVVPNETCPSGGSSISGVAFHPASGGEYPANYRGALFFSDYNRDCIWAMLPGTNGLPNPANIVTFVAGASNPVDLEAGPGGDLFYVNIEGGTIQRVRYNPNNAPPTAVASATPNSGTAPLAVQFNATGSSDPDPGEVLAYAWDFTNDGTTDATGLTASHTYPSNGNFTAKLTVTDTLGATDTELVPISVGNGPPTATIDTPAAGTSWTVGDTISFTGHASDPQQGTLPANALDWQLRLYHCHESDPTDCHIHYLQDYPDVAGGSFTAPDHEYPSYLELALTATDSGGLAHTVTRRLDPTTVALTFATDPAGLQLTAGSTTAAAPFTKTVIVGSSVGVNAPSPQSAGGTSYGFQSWSDGGAQSHAVTAPATASTYTARYAAASGSPGITGTVSNTTTGLGLAGATVTLSPGGATTTTNASGGYSFAGLAAGSYQLTAKLGNGRCVPPRTVPVTVDGPEVVDVALDQKTDTYGYSCVDAPAAFVPASTVMPLTGDDAVAKLDLPFSFSWYGTPTSAVWVDTNGMLTVAAHTKEQGYTYNPLPTPAGPNGIIAPFWNDMVVDSYASVRTSVVGAAPNRQVVIEWRNVAMYSYRSHRVTFSVVLGENGTVTFHYAELYAARPDELGSLAAVGIESQTGAVGIGYSYRQPVLANGVAITFRKP
ncbi:MAG: PQQ-dependent sugar dehydrogenase [Micromonosporaceae bacterium]